MNPLYFKALHIIFIVTWFAGLFYIFRLFVYHAEALKKEEPVRSILCDQYRIMEHRLWYIITWPSAVLALLFGFLMMFTYRSGLWKEPYMHLKLFFVALLIVYQFFGQTLMARFKRDESLYSSFVLRLLNEVATILLIAIVFIIVMRDSISWIWGTFGILGLAGLLAYSVAKYRKHREKQSRPE
jgi:protoporphyrinogen IX oxidase